MDSVIAESLPKAKRKKATPLKGRSSAFMRKNGWKCGDVERHVPGVFITFDFMGFADLLAFKLPLIGVLAIQVTSASNAAAHRDKMAACENIPIWLLCGNKIELHLWSMKGKKDERKLWTLETQDVFLDEEKICFTERKTISNNLNG